TKAGVRGDGSVGDGLEPFIVSTLDAARRRESAVNQLEDPQIGRLEGEDSVIRMPGSDAPAPTRFLQGCLLWPALTPEQQKKLKGEKRDRAVVYLDSLPEFRAVVFEEDGRFVLPVTERIEDAFGSKGVRIVVHSPINETSGGFEAVLVKKDDGPIPIK